jgi:hypothetical protein
VDRLDKKPKKKQASVLQPTATPAQPGENPEIAAP